MITHKQITLAEVFEDCQNKFDNDKYQFLSLLDEAINLDEIVPVSFVSHFHAQTGRPRKHQLYPMLRALLLQRIFSIPVSYTHLDVYKRQVNASSISLADFCITYTFTKSAVTHPLSKTMIPSSHTSIRPYTPFT